MTQRRMSLGEEEKDEDCLKGALGVSDASSTQTLYLLYGLHYDWNCDKQHYYHAHWPDRERNDLCTYRNRPFSSDCALLYAFPPMTSSSGVSIMSPVSRSSIVI